MIITEFGSKKLVCDVCDINEREIEKGGEEFSASIGDAQEEGWVIRRRDNGWHHICPTCATRGKSLNLRRI